MDSFKEKGRRPGLARLGAEDLRRREGGAVVPSSSGEGGPRAAGFVENMVWGV